MLEFQYVSHPQEVIFASGLFARLKEIIDRSGWQRLMLCTNRSLSANGRADSLVATLGDRLVIRYSRPAPCTGYAGG